MQPKNAKRIRDLDPFTAARPLEPSDELIVASSDGSTRRAKISDTVQEGISAPGFVFAPPGGPFLQADKCDNAGDMLLYRESGGYKLDPKPFLVKAMAGRGSPEVSSAQATHITFDQILSSFYRFHHVGRNATAQYTAEQPGYFYNNSTGAWTLAPAVSTATVPSGFTWYSNLADHSYWNNGVFWQSDYKTFSQLAAGWFLNSNGELAQPTNTIGNIGFGSIDTFTEYEARVVFKSTNGDNDRIGWVIALNRTPGRPDRTISLIRNRDTWNSLQWGFVYNLGFPDQKVLATNHDNILGGNNSTLGGGNGAWSNTKGEAAKISRTPTGAKAYLAVQQSIIPDDSSSLWSNEVSIDFDDASYGVDLTWAKEPASWGLCALSQPHCSWGNLFFASTKSAFADKSAQGVVFDIESGEAWKYNEVTGVWESHPASIRDFVDNGQAFFDLANKSLYYKQRDILQPLLSERKPLLTYDGDFNITPNTLSHFIVANGSNVRVTLTDKMAAGWHCTVINHTSGTLTFQTTGGAWLNGTGSSGSVSISQGQNFQIVADGTNDGFGVTVLKMPT